MGKLYKYNRIVALTLLALTLMAANSFCIDPMYIGVGARALGMGKAYVAVAEDADTVFMNPAGLGGIDQLKISSMYTTLLDDVNYAVLGGAYPIDGDMGVIGGGLIRSSVDNIPLYDETGILLPGSSNFENSVLFVSYGLDLGKMKGYGDISKTFNNVYVGGNLKYFSKSASGVSGMNGSGFGMDLGVLYKYAPYMQFGANLQNIINTGIQYSGTGVSDVIPTILKIGTKINVVGDRKAGKAYMQGDYTLDAVADYDIDLSEKIPSVMHLGLEYRPIKMLTIRAGIDQNPAPEGVQNNLTLGLGLDYEGAQFNYAYHPYGEIPGATHFFSICYVGLEKEAPKPVVEISKPIITLSAPQDKTITKDHIIKVEGVVRADAGVNEIEVNGDPVQINAGKFETVVQLTIGKNLIEVKATAVSPEVKTETVSARIIRTIKFSDVQDDFWAARQIEDCATVGLVNGYPDGTFAPLRALSRAELSTLLVKAKDKAVTTPTKAVFKDLPKLHWASSYVKGAVELGLVKGYPNGTFKPNNKINRAEGVMVMGRFDELQEPEYIEVGPYPDLTAKYWASKMVTVAKAQGLLGFVGEGEFNAKKELTRAEAVDMISKTRLGMAKVDNLHDWSVGFIPGGPGSMVSLKTFNDVKANFWALKPIQYLATVGIIGGYPDGNFKPEKALTRAELCTLLVKAKGVPANANSTASFGDLPASHWAANYVKSAVDMGLVTGYPDGKFKPNKQLSRAETVAIIARFDKLDTNKELSFGPFPDMTAKHWSAKYINAAKEAGILEYLKGQDFQPERQMTRAEAAEMIAKTQFGTAKIKEVFGKNVDMKASSPTAPASSM